MQRSPRNAERRPQPKGGAPDEQTKQNITVHQYSTSTFPLPLVPALMVDAWPDEVVLSLRLHRALRRLVAALAAAEGGQP